MMPDLAHPSPCPGLLLKVKLLLRGSGAITHPFLQSELPPPPPPPQAKLSIQRRPQTHSQVRPLKSVELFDFPHPVLEQQCPLESTNNVGTYQSIVTTHLHGPGPLRALFRCWVVRGPALPQHSARLCCQLLPPSLSPPTCPPMSRGALGVGGGASLPLAGHCTSLGTSGCGMGK